MLCKDVFDLREYLNGFNEEELEDVRLSIDRVDDVEPGTFETEELRAPDGKIFMVNLFVHYDD